jgi:fructose-1,6-bisphosphatase
LNEINKDGEYIVSYDPIDGSTVIDSNFSVATIFAVWRAKDIIGMSGKDLEGAGVTIYGSRTSIILYNSQSMKVEELTLLRMGQNERWIVTNPDLKIKADAKLFSPAMKSAYEHPTYFKLFEEYCLKGHSIRYSGAYAVDCF